jgi:hypothetical protein
MVRPCQLVALLLTLQGLILVVYGKFKGRGARSGTEHDVGQSTPSEIRLIGLFAFEATSSVAKVALEDVNSNPIILPGVTLSMSYGDSKRNQSLATSLFLDEIRPVAPFPPKIGVVGEWSSRVCLSLTYVASYYRIPQISYACTSKNDKCVLPSWRSR